MLFVDGLNTGIRASQIITLWIIFVFIHIDIPHYYIGPQQKYWPPISPVLYLTDYQLFEILEPRDRQRDSR